MDLATLQALGIKPDDLAQRIVDQAVETLLTSNGYDEDGDECSVASDMAKRVTTNIKAAADAKIATLFEQHILPTISQHVEGLILQETNRWGEKTGKQVTFIEYLVQRADAYIREDVNYQGKTQAEDSYSWSKSTTRVAYMVNQHLHYSIETAMKQALANANSSIAKGLEGAVKAALESATAKLKVDVKTA